MIHVNYDAIFASVLVIGLPFASVLTGCVLRFLGRRRLGRAFLLASVGGYVGSAFPTRSSSSADRYRHFCCILCS